MTTTEIPADAPENIIRRVQSLLERAAHAGTDEHEREVCQQKAEALMAKFKLDRAMLNFQRKGKRVNEPVHRVYDKLNLADNAAMQTNRDWKEEVGIEFAIKHLRQDIYSHAGCRYYETGAEFNVVGYEEDIFYADMLWTNVFMDVTQNLFPRWNNEIGFDANVFYLKNAGFSWPQVREIGLANNARDRSGALTYDNAGSKLRTGYNRHAKKVGFVKPKEQPRNPNLYRRSMVDGYASRLRARLYELKQSSKMDVGKEGELALVQDADYLQEYLWTLFPHLRPKEYTEEELEAMRQENANIKPTRYRKPPKAREADPRAWQAGHDAANRVKLTQNDVGSNNTRGIE